MKQQPKNKQTDSGFVVWGKKTPASPEMSALLTSVLITKTVAAWFQSKNGEPHHASSKQTGR